MAGTASMSRRGHAVKHKVRFVDTDESPEKNSFPPVEESAEVTDLSHAAETGVSAD
jgi:hypothetical protein